MTMTRVLLGTSYTVMMLMLLLHPNHMMDQSWSLHAEIHLRQAINWAVGLCVMGLVMTFWGFRPYQRWVWWALVINGTCLFAGYSVPPLLLAQGPFSPFDVWGMSGLAVLNMLGLFWPTAINLRCRAQGLMIHRLSHVTTPRVPERVSAALHTDTPQTARQRLRP